MKLFQNNGISLWTKICTRKGRFFHTVVENLRSLFRFRKAYTSETSRVRPLLAPYCVGYGCDIGHGGDKILPDSIGIDRPQPYALVGKAKNDISCCIEDGLPVADNTYDYVYSSHLIEDFFHTKAILGEMARVLKVGGNLVLAFPDQPAYAAHCRQTGQLLNTHHQVSHMGLAYMLEQLKGMDGFTWEIVFTFDVPTVDNYNVGVVARLKQRGSLPRLTSRFN